VIRARTSSLLGIVIGLVLAAALPAAASSGGATGTLHIHATLDTTPWQTVDCPPGTSSPNPSCYAFTGTAVVPGLGQTTESYSLYTDPSAPARLTATIGVPGEGTINVSGTTSQPVCGCGEAALDYTITGGTGTYTDASGSGTTTVESSIKVALWSGTLTVPDYTFDTTPPMISGAKAKTVRAPKTAKHVRVKYSVTARDPGFGPVPVTCKPHSGSGFKIGRTTVRCTATDAVDNTATARFRITVKRR
jgi:hypothetical protein